MKSGIDSMSSLSYPCPLKIFSRKELAVVRIATPPSPIPASYLFDSQKNRFKSALTDGEIQLWLISLRVDKHTLRTCFDSLTSDEKLRAQSYLSEPARHRYIMTRAVLRQIIRSYHDNFPAGYPISTGTFGKPFLELGEQETPICFNVSHSGSLALMGFSSGIEIGVDIEEERWLSGLMGIAQRVFSEREFKFLQTFSKLERSKVFYRLWTCKEASLKADGTGFHRAPESLCLFSGVESGNELSRFIRVDGQSIQWARHSFGYSLAWAAQFIGDPKVSWVQFAKSSSFH